MIPRDSRDIDLLSIEVPSGGLGVEKMGSHIGLDSEQRIEVGERFIVVPRDIEVLRAEVARAEQRARGGGGVGGERSQPQQQQRLARGAAQETVASQRRLQTPLQDVAHAQQVQTGRELRLGDPSFSTMCSESSDCKDVRESVNSVIGGRMTQLGRIDDDVSNSHSFLR